MLFDVTYLELLLDLSQLYIVNGIMPNKCIRDLYRIFGGGGHKHWPSCAVSNKYIAKCLLFVVNVFRECIDEITKWFL